MKLRCLLVDDEPYALKILFRYAAKTPNLEIVASCLNALEVLVILQSEAVDVMFLDINMPGLSGLELVKTLKEPPKIVFATAYPEYGVEGFEVEAVDFLVKPFSYERFLKAVNRVVALVQTQSGSQDSMIIKADKKLHQVKFDQILYLEAYGDYVKVYLKDQMLLTKDRLSKLEKQLPEPGFIRIHRSFIVRKAAIQYIEGNQVRVRDANIPISQSYRDNLLSKM